MFIYPKFRFAYMHAIHSHNDQSTADNDGNAGGLTGILWHEGKVRVSLKSLMFILCSLWLSLLNISTIQPTCVKVFH